MRAPTKAVAVEPEANTHRATALELFFDLVYVFAFTQVTQLMADGETGLGVLRGLAVLGILWWSWASHAWLANQRLADRGIVRVGIFAGIAIVFVLSVSIPEAYHDDPGGLSGPMVFAGGFVLLSVIYTLVNLVVAGPDLPLRRQVLLTMGTTIIPVSAALIIGALMGGIAQLVLWLGAVVIEGMTVYFSSRGGEWQLTSAAHYAERHGLVVILALGESIISIGLGAAQSPISAAIIVGCLLSVLLAVAMWWNYFARLSPAAEHEIERHTGAERAAVATIGTYLHLGIVTGILLVSLGLGGAVKNLADTEPLGLFSACALGTGLALYLASTASYWWRCSGRTSQARFWAAVFALALIPVTASTPAVLAIGSMAGISVGLAIFERVLEFRGRTPFEING